MKIRFVFSTPLVLIPTLSFIGCADRVVYDAPPPPPPPATAYYPPPPEAAPVVVDQPPPVPLTEVIPYSPGPGYVWIGGAWVWHGRWGWEHGHWARPPHRGYVWHPHHYEYRNGVTVFVHGYWH